MKLNWFKRNGIVFLPISIIGWIILLIGFIYSIYTFIDIDSRSHSVSDTLINFVFKLLIIIAVYSLIAYLTSRSSKND
jgi:membrane protein DedA with SNARE-associated domain